MQSNRGVGLMNIDKRDSNDFVALKSTASSVKSDQKTCLGSMAR